MVFKSLLENANPHRRFSEEMVRSQSTSRDLIMSQKSNSFHWIIVFALLGFMGTGFLFYPYGITRDSQASFTAIFSGFDSNVSWVGINNWMGWFVPGLWKWLRSLTVSDHFKMHHLWSLQSAPPLTGVFLGFLGSFWQGVFLFP